MAVMKKNIKFMALCAFAILFLVSPARAELTAVSGKPDPAVNEVIASGDPTQVAFSLAHGFPLWYRDLNGLKLELCLDKEVATASGTFFPCLTEEPFAGGPVSFPSNFGSEAFWWSATAFGTFTSSLDGAPLPGDALLVMGQEAAFAFAVLDGSQTAFGRIRIRINVPVPGTYEVTHPYGTATYVVPVAGTLAREINQTQDIGNFLVSGPPPTGNFLLALANGPAPVLPPGFDPGIDAAIVADVATGIGPFLVPDGLLPVVALNGNRYLSDPGTLLVPRMVPVTGGPNGNVFRIRLLNPPAGFLLNAAGNSQEIVFDQFQVHGKIFNDGPNLAPVASDDLAATGKDRPISIDVTANDLDISDGANVHGLNPQAIALPSANPADLPGTFLLTQPQATAQGGTVRRFTSIVTGKATFTYTPPPGFTGEDTFTYVVQDTGGLISAPATVTVLVEELQSTRAEYRTKQGKWRIAGTSSDTSPHTISLFTDPRATLSGAAEVPAVVSPARGLATLAASAEAIDFEISLDPLPASSVTAVQIQAGAAGTNGPVIFTLYDSRSTLPLANPLSGRSLAFNLQPRPEIGINNFSDALNAILSGNAYINVQTTAQPGGEIRGQLARPLIGTATVAANGSWSFQGKSRTLPGKSRSIGIQSDKGVHLLAVPLKMK